MSTLSYWSDIGIACRLRHCGWFHQEARRHDSHWIVRAFRPVQKRERR